MSLGPLMGRALNGAARGDPLPHTTDLLKQAEQAIALQGRRCQEVTRARQCHALQVFTSNKKKARLLIAELPEVVRPDKLFGGEYLRKTLRKVCKEDKSLREVKAPLWY